MAESKYPYIPSPGILIKTIDQFRKNFPPKVDSDVLKKLSLASNNEGIVISTFKYLGILDEKGNKTDIGKNLFLIHDNQDFAKEFEKVVLNAYSGLFELRGDEAWVLDRNNLIGFFRQNDGTSELTATRQAIAFETLRSLAGHGLIKNTTDSSKKTTTNQNSTPKKNKVKDTSTNEEKPPKGIITNPSGDVGLTVRIEINLPAQGDQETYDRIFQSIKRNLLNGK